MLRSDGAGVAKGMIGGLGVLAVVLVIAGIIWLVRIPFKRAEKGQFPSPDMRENTPLANNHSSNKINAFRSEVTKVELLLEAVLTGDLASELCVSPKFLQGRVTEKIAKAVADKELASLDIVQLVKSQLRPFDDDAKNELLAVCRRFGEEAEAEFAELCIVPNIDLDKLCKQICSNVLIKSAHPGLYRADKVGKFRIYQNGSVKLLETSDGAFAEKQYRTLNCFVDEFSGKIDLHQLSREDEPHVIMWPM